MSSFTAVRVAENPHRYGNPDAYTPSLIKVLPWPVLDILDVFRGITYEKDHVDQDSNPTLGQIITLSARLIQHYDEHVRLDTDALGEIIQLLSSVEKEEDPLKIFYPQLAARTATSTFEAQRREEEERIRQAQESARGEAAAYKETAKGLLTLLETAHAPGMGPKDSKVIEEVKAFSQMCEKAVHEQKGLLARGMSVASKQVMATIEKMREAYFPKKSPSKGTGVVAGHHPLVELLTLISDHSFSSGVEKEAKIKDALPRLEQYDSSFTGIKQFVEARVPPPYRDLEGLRRALHLFLMDRFISKMNPHEYLQDALLRIYSLACHLVDDPLLRNVSEVTELEWVISQIQDPDVETDHAIEMVRAQFAYDRALMALYEAALDAPDLDLQEKKPPPLRASDADKLQWASRTLGNTTLEAKCPREVTEAKRLKEERINGKSAKAIQISQIEKKVEWAKAHLKATWALQHGVNMRYEDQGLKDVQGLYQRLIKQIEARQDLLRTIVQTATSISECHVNEDSRPEEIEEWLKQVNLSNYRKHREFVRLVMRARGEVKDPHETDRDLLDFCVQARRLGLEGVPDERTEEGHQILWAKRVIDGEIACENETLTQLRGEIREDLHDQFIASLVYTHGRLRRDESAQDFHTPKQKIEWGQGKVKECFKALFRPEDSKALKGAELVWMATAHYQQLQELDRIRVKVTTGTEDGPLPIEDILLNLNEVIHALEINRDLIGKDQAEKLTKELVEPILDWMTLSHAFCRHEKGNAIEEKEVDELFEPIFRDIRAENYLDAFKQLKVLLEKSPLLTKKLLEKTPTEHLDGLGHAFNLFLKEKPPQKISDAHRQILATLGLQENTPVTDQVLSNGVELQRTTLVSNVLVLLSYKFLNIIFKGWGQRKPEIAQDYKKYREAMDAIARDNFNSDNVEAAMNVLLEGSPLSTEEKAQCIRNVRDTINELKISYASTLGTPAGNKTILIKTIPAVLSALVKANTQGHELESHVARLFLPIFLAIVDLFIEPFSKTLIERFTKDVILESNGTLTKLHLQPFEGLNSGFAIYNDGVDAWSGIAADNARGSPDVPAHLRYVNGGQQQTAMKHVLNTPRLYEGLRPDQIDQKGLYMCVDQYLHVANHCQDIDALFGELNRRLLERSYANPLLNGIAFGIKGLLSLLPYTYAWGYYIVLKTSEILINFSLQHIAKFAVWYTQAGTNFLMQALNTTVQSSSYTTALDKILLEKLKDLQSDLEREMKLAKSEKKGAKSVNDESVRALISHLKRTLVTIQCDTADDAMGHQKALEGLKALETFITDQVKDAVSPIIIRTIESFLHRESMLLALYRGLELANKGVREETEPLTEAQMTELRQETRKEAPDEADIKDKIERIHDGLKDEMGNVLKKILETAAHPSINRAIDDFAKQPGQVVSETISWLEKALYSESSNGESENVIKELEKDFAQLDGGAHHDATLHHMYETYSHFIKVFREHEEDLKRHQSYNGILLKRDVLNVVAEPLDTLTIALAEVMKAPRDAGKKEALRLALEGMKRAVGTNRPALNRVKESETTSHAERHRGMMGRTLGSWEVLLSTIKGKSKPVVHEGMKTAAQFLTRSAMKIPRNPVLVQHLVRRVFLLFVKA
ncbi:MAG: hypothetical protein H7A38_05015 [Chlamydiales bacterium]|nr:hypothetical protein [Chlamydiales bacterium]